MRYPHCTPGLRLPDGCSDLLALTIGVGQVDTLRPGSIPVYNPASHETFPQLHAETSRHVRTEFKSGCPVVQMETMCANLQARPQRLRKLVSFSHCMNKF